MSSKKSNLQTSWRPFFGGQISLPYAASFRQKDRRLTSFVNLADVEGHRDLHLKFNDDELALADRDRLREDLRLLYVALTRARHALWVGFSAIKTGNSSACISHKSGAGYVLGGTNPVAARDWLTPLNEFAATCTDINLQPADESVPCTALTGALTEVALQERPRYQANFERDWSIGSFSRLARDLMPTLGASELSPLQAPRPADDEPDLATSAQEAQALQREQTSVNPTVWHKFARGAEAGNFLHDQLEWLATEGFALSGNEALAARLRRRCERAGRGAHAEGVVSWLSEVLQTILPGPDAALVDLVNVLPEMEFWLPAHRMDAQEIDAQCRSHLLPGIERPRLAERQLHGMLMGFADLVFEHQGKYWMLDYKSNHLGDDDAAYDSQALANSMAEHRYDVQAAIYMLALHRLLKLRLGSHYQPDEHLGGAVYLFLRGVKGAQNGVCLMPVCPPLLEALDAMLGQEALPA
jgi:exodeoxyribonuclease V beta subunit